MVNEDQKNKRYMMRRCSFTLIAEAQNVLAPRLLYFGTFSSSETDEAGPWPWESSEPRFELSGWAWEAIAAAEAAAKRAGFELKSEARAELAPKEVSERDKAADAEI